MKYDDASWHYDGDFPADLAPECGATHIGMFLGWVIMRGHVGDLHIGDDDSAADVRKVQAREMSPRAFLIQWCDEKLTDEDLTDEANAFATEYYEKQYFQDYALAFPESDEIYRVEDSWTNFELIAAVLDERFRSWRQSRPA